MGGYFYSFSSLPRLSPQILLTAFNTVLFAYLTAVADFIVSTL